MKLLLGENAANGSNEIESGGMIPCYALLERRKSTILGSHTNSSHRYGRSVRFSPIQLMAPPPDPFSTSESRFDIKPTIAFARLSIGFISTPLLVIFSLLFLSLQQEDADGAGFERRQRETTPIDKMHLRAYSPFLEN